MSFWDIFFCCTLCTPIKIYIHIYICILAKCETDKEPINPTRFPAPFAPVMIYVAFFTGIYSLCWYDYTVYCVWWEAIKLFWILNHYLYGVSVFSVWLHVIEILILYLQGEETSIDYSHPSEGQSAVGEQPQEEDQTSQVRNFIFLIFKPFFSLKGVHDKIVRFSMNWHLICSNIWLISNVTFDKNKTS